MDVKIKWKHAKQSENTLYEMYKNLQKVLMIVT